MGVLSPIRKLPKLGSIPQSRPAPTLARAGPPEDTRFDRGREQKTGAERLSAASQQLEARGWNLTRFCMQKRAK